VQLPEGRCATGRGTRYGEGLPTFPSFSPRGALDRVDYRGLLHVASARSCRLRLFRVASDHLPAIVELDLRG
jgi:endonuclease/exonuclease/phosphatase family metal-dependent hydrolase